MVAKGLDFPRVSLVGVISADTQMLLPDFRSAERTFQLLTQVAGRAGRSSLRGEVVIQSYQTDHYALKHVLKHDYEGFYTEELRYREETAYPPFSRIVLLEFRGLRDADVQSIAKQISCVDQEREATGHCAWPGCCRYRKDSESISLACNHQGIASD